MNKEKENEAYWLEQKRKVEDGEDIKTIYIVVNEGKTDEIKAIGNLPEGWNYTIMEVDKSITG